MWKRISVVAAFSVWIAAAAFAASAMDKETLIVGTSGAYPPYEFHGQSGDLVGFDVDMTEAIARKLGKKLQWLDMPFDSLLPSLMADKIDLVSAGLSATPERAKRVSFSSPYEISYSAFVTRVDYQPKSADGLAGKTVAVQIGTVQETFARALGNVEVKTYQKFDECVREVALGRVDATLMDIPAAKAYVKAKDFDGKIAIAFNRQITGADKAIAISKKNVELTAAVSRIIEEMDKNGELQALRDKWFKE
ncbi:transporter substrate-binding domain-containing protein [Pyramidobacter piscolens]|uniref:transporter substrate-binding domain-containing protein n=1 Tax=Pyramidobacter piscolens TaxID=638849 RepID=UPI002490F07D|nr:transporter substrate-binding domain-containing protein [Pyramidobacter piscolens]